MATKHVVTLFDLTAEQIERVFEVSAELKRKLRTGVRESLLPGRVLALIFEKPSLRTRVSFETAITHLGGASLFLGDDVGWGKREPTKDFGRVLSEYVDAVVVRSKSHSSIEDLASHCSCSVINGLSDLAHPCQALADLFTMHERRGDLSQQKLAYIGDANNVARSLAIACGKMNVEMTVAAPLEHRFDKPFLERLNRECPQFKLTETDDPIAAVKNATAVYTDVWVSMGQEAESAARLKTLAPYQVNEDLMKHAPADAIVLHCLPARRDEEITDGVFECAQSAIIQQAGNRMHVQKGLIACLLGAFSW